MLLADWIEQNPDRDLDGVAYSLDWLLDLPALGITSKNPPVGLIDDRLVTAESISTHGPTPGRYVVFVRPLREQDRRYEYFQAFQPIQRLGYTAYIYELTSDDVSAYWRNRIEGQQP